MENEEWRVLIRGNFILLAPYSMLDKRRGNKE